MGYSIHDEPHFSQRNNWLRATVLGANDGLISSASLLMGMAALVGGAISMAAGEYVSVSSQSDTEQADLRKEAYELENNSEQELQELVHIYRQRGLDEALANEVAHALTAHNALEAHARDEIGLTEISTANPLQAAGASAFAFCIGAVLPVLVALLSPPAALMWLLAITTLLGLAGLGYLSAKLGGAPARPAVLRIVIWGVIALSCTSLLGHWFGLAL